MFDVGWLQPSAADLHLFGLAAFYFSDDPALEHVDHLELDGVSVPLTDLVGAGWHEFDDMGDGCTFGRLRHAEVTIFCMRAKAGREVVGVEMADGKGLLGRHDRLARVGD